MKLASKQLCLICLAGLSLAGCVLPPLGPNYKRPQVPLPTAWRVEPGEAADLINTSWWREFGDENLNLLIDQALRSNSDLLIATARVEQYAAKLHTTNSRYFPQIGADVGFERNMRSQEVPELLRPGVPPTFNDWKGLLTISYEFDIWGKVRRSYEASRAQLLSTEQVRHTVMLTVVTSVATTYFELLAADRELELARETLDSLKRSWDLTDKKYHGGSATDIQVAEARAQYEYQSAVIPDVERKIAFLEDDLSTLLGRNPGPVPRGRIDKVVLMRVPGGIPGDVLTRRPDIMAAEQDLVAANATIGIAKTGYFPTFSLTSDYGQSSDSTRWLLAKTARTGDLALDLIGPIFTFGRVEGDVAAARAMTKEQRERYLQTVQTALKEVDQSLVYNAQSRLRVAAFDRHVVARQAVDTITKVRFKGGSATDLDVLDEDRHVYDAQNEQNNATRDEFLALISVYKAMGGGWMLATDQALASKKQSGAVVPTTDVQTPTPTKGVSAP